MPSLPQSLLLRLCCTQRTHPPELEDGEMDQDETPIIQWEIVSDYYTIQMLMSLWGQMGFNHVCGRSWQKCSPNHFQ